MTHVRECLIAWRHVPPADRAIARAAIAFFIPWAEGKVRTNDIITVCVLQMLDRERDREGKGGKDHIDNTNVG